MSKIKRWSTQGLAIVLVLALAVRSSAADRQRPDQVQFGLADGNTMAGFVYGAEDDDRDRDDRDDDRDDERGRKPLVIMVHGASDSHTVFDFAPGFRAARELAAAGFDVVTVDRVGYGASSRPSGDSLSFAVAAGYLHEVIQAVRRGALGFRPPSVVVLGASVGADIAIVEAGTYHDVDGVAICFNTSQLQPALFAVDIRALLAQGPYFDFGVDFRTSFFYRFPFASQRIVDLDNATRSLVPRREIVSALNGESAPFRAAIAVPVLLMQADGDHLFVPRDDSALFSGSPDVTFALLRRAGHKGFSHPTSKDQAVRTVRSWLRTQF
jgi:pimeloyl-ACP methyl ester carboxylesterase